MYSCFIHLLYLDRLSWANVIKWKGSLRSPSLFTPDLIVVVLSIYIRRELMSMTIARRGNNNGFLDSEEELQYACIPETSVS